MMLHACVRRCVGVAAVVFALVVSVAGQQPATDGFVPLSELADREVLPAAPLVFYAYGFVWVAIVCYLWSLRRRMARVEEDLQAVRRRMSETGGR